MTLDFAGTNCSTVSRKAPPVSRVNNLCLGALLLLIAGINASCGFSSGAANAAPPAQGVSVSISPTSATLSANSTKQFTDTVSNTTNQAVIWTAGAGTISTTGLFTAPTVTSTTQISVTVTSVADNSKQASATVTINPAGTAPVSVTISPTTATVSSNGTKQFTATVNNASNQAVTWTASAGTISTTGLFTAPIVTSVTQASVTATSVADTSAHASATVTINPANTAPVSVTISPTTATVSSKGTKQFTATVNNASNQAVTWTASAGTISTTGLFTPPTVTSATQASVTATSVADNSKHASASVTIDPSPPTILTSAAPNATIGQLYNTSLSASGGQLPYEWSIASGALPQGLELNSARGTIAGTANTTGLYSFSAKVTDALLQSSTRSFTLVVSNGNQPNTIPSSYFGMHLMDPADWPAGHVGSLGKAPATTWPYLEPAKGVFDWSRLDAYVQAAQTNGVSFYFSNDYVPAWAAADPSTCSLGVMNTTVCTSTVANLQDWDDFVDALVTRYNGKIQMYELWNEPDQKYFTGTVEQMVTLTSHMYSIVRALDPQALIAAPSAGDTTWLDSYWAAGGVKTVDLVTTHDYPDPRNPVGEVICAFRSLPLKALMTKYGIQKPIWDTEGSWGTASALSDPNLQAAFAARFEILHWACGVERFYWYAWEGGSHAPYWGLLWTPSAGPTGAGVAFKIVEKWLNGATMPGGCLMNGAAIPAPPTLFHGIYTCNLTRPGGYQGQAVWNTDGSSTYTAPSRFVQYRNLAGNIYMLPANHHVAIGYKPILLEN